jgi:hypothetical protein
MLLLVVCMAYYSTLKLAAVPELRDDISQKSVRYIETKYFGVDVTLCASIRKVLGWDTDNPDCFCGFPLSL